MNRRGYEPLSASVGTLCAMDRSNMMESVRSTKLTKRRTENVNEPTKKKVKTCPINLSSKERLPEGFFPSKGHVRVAKHAKAVKLYRESPVHDRWDHVATITYHDEIWREYTNAFFHESDGFHYLRIKLLPDDIRTGSSHESSRVSVDKLAKDEGRFHVVKSISCEIDKPANAVIKKYAPDTVHLGSVENLNRALIKRKIMQDPIVKKYLELSLSKDKTGDAKWFAQTLHFVIVAGPPCQNLSNAGNQTGILGKKSILFFYVPQIVRHITSEVEQILEKAGATKEKLFYSAKGVVHYLVENVDIVNNRDRDVFTEFLGNKGSCRIDFNESGCCTSLMNRRRQYWCSFMPRGQEIGITDLKKYGESCIHPAKRANKTLEDVLTVHGLDGYEYYNRKNGKKVKHLTTMTRFAENVGQENFFIRRIGTDVPFDQAIEAPQTVNEDLMGFPIDHTKVIVEGQELTEAERRKLIGNSFMIFHINFFLIKLHEHMLDPYNFYGEGNAYVKFLPHEICELRLKNDRSDSEIDREASHHESKWYRDLLTELNRRGFQNLTSGTIYDHF
eukprot:scaffold8660_cov50-Attheya_sp.AAC.4